MVVIDRGDGQEWLLSDQNACPGCGLSFPELSPAMFSFNSPLGMCPECSGLGIKYEFDPERFIDPDKTLAQGGVRTWGELGTKRSSGTYKVARQIVEHFGHNLDMRWHELSKECQQAILYGGVRVSWHWQSAHSSGGGEWDYEGAVNAVRRRYRQTQSDYMRRWYATFMSPQACPGCEGRRLRPESRAVTMGENAAPGNEHGDRRGAAWVSSLLRRG
jgi:excinuclease ABC subunit A